MSTKSEPSLIPRPVKMSVEPGVFNLTSKTGIRYAGKSAEQPARLFAEQIRPASGFTLSVHPSGSSYPDAIVFEISDDEQSHCEAYSLDVTPSQVKISAGSPAGLFYGAQTLRQLLPPEIFSCSTVASCSWSIPCVKIQDFPRFDWRGMHLDVSRHFMPKNDILRFIDAISALKLNRFHWHLTDDQGWRIEIKKYPELTRIGAWRKETLTGHYRDRTNEWTYDGIPHGGFYTQEVVREIVRYAADRFVTIVPEIDMPGHMQAAIAAYPAMGTATEPIDVRTSWGISKSVLHPDKSALQFCKDVLEEVAALFPGELIHIGGDEVDKTEWEASDRVRQLCYERSLNDMTEMQSWFTCQIEAFLASRRRRLIGWDEILEGGLAGRATVMAWRDEQRGVLAAKAGHPVVMAVKEYLYFDFYQANPVEEEPLAWGGFIPLEKVYSFNPVPPGLTEEERALILGAQGQLWTEYMPDMCHVEYMAFPRTCALAEVVWTPELLKNYDHFVSRLPDELRRLQYAGVHYREMNKQTNRLRRSGE